MEKSADAYRTISEVADQLNLPQHVLRFWETRFPQVKPLKRGGNRRFYRPDDIDLLRAIKTLLYGDGFTIKGVQRVLKEQGPRAVATLAQTGQLRSSVRRGADGEAGPSLADGAAAGETSGVSPEPPASRGGPINGSDEAEHLEAEAVPGDVVDRLQAVLFELSECERILAAARA